MISLFPQVFCNLLKTSSSFLGSETSCLLFSSLLSRVAIFEHTGSYAVLEISEEKNIQANEKFLFMTLTQDAPGSWPNPLGSGFSASSVSSGDLYPGRQGSWCPLRTPAFSARPFHPRVLCSDSPHRQAQSPASRALGSSGWMVRVRVHRPAASRVRAQPGDWTRGGSPVLLAPSATYMGTCLVCVTPQLHVDFLETLQGLVRRLRLLWGERRR